MTTVTGQRLATELRLDEDVHLVAEFMQRNLAAGKLVAVAEALPKVARLLWAEYPQEPCAPAQLAMPKTGPESLSPVDAT
jgi:hypothetical protein